jgi:hypothetical protein
MSNQNPIDQRKYDLAFVQHYLRYGAQSMFDGRKVERVYYRYPLEFWYICYELKPQFYNLQVRQRVEKLLEGINASLN